MVATPQPKAPDDRLLKYFTATEKLLLAADSVREARNALLVKACQNDTATTKSEVQHD